MSDFSVPSCIHIPALSPPLQAGTYDATFSYSVVGSGTPQSAPEQLGRVTVAPLAAPAAPLHRRLSGNWFDPAAPGTGVNLVQGVSGALMAAWLTHAPMSSADWVGPGIVQGSWLVMSEGLWIAPNVFRGPLFATRASPPLRTWDASKFSITPSGFAKFTFVSAQEVRFEVVLLHGVDSNLTQAHTLRRFSF